MYAEIADVERLMAHFQLGTGSRPTQSQVEAIIADTEAEVNATLSANRIILPLTDETFLGWVRLLVSYGATAAVLKSMFPSATGPGENPAFAFWESRYKNGLKGILEGTLVPDTVERTKGNRAKPSTYFTRNPNREEYLGDIAEPFFKRGRFL